MSQDVDDGLLPLGAMASLLGVQTRELRREALEGRLPCVRIGEGGLLFDPVAVVEALRERARLSAAELRGSTSASTEDRP